MAAYYDRLYLSTWFDFLLIEGVWLRSVARGFYGKSLGVLLKSNPDWSAAILRVA